MLPTPNSERTANISFDYTGRNQSANCRTAEHRHTYPGDSPLTYYGKYASGKLGGAYR